MSYFNGRRIKDGLGTYKKKKPSLKEQLDQQRDIIERLEKELLLQTDRAVVFKEMADIKNEKIAQLEQANRELREGLEKIANYPHPTFNGERVWTISDISQPTKIAKDLLTRHSESGEEGKSK